MTFRRVRAPLLAPLVFASTFVFLRRATAQPRWNESACPSVETIRFAATLPDGSLRSTTLRLIAFEPSFDPSEFTECRRVSTACELIQRTASVTGPGQPLRADRFHLEALVGDLERTDPRNLDDGQDRLLRKLKAQLSVMEHRAIGRRVLSANLPPDLREALERTDRSEIVAMVGRYRSWNAASLHLRTEPQEAILLSGFSNDKPLTLEGAGIVILGRGNSLLGALDVRGPKVFVARDGALVEAPSLSSPRALGGLPGRSLPLLEEALSLTETYCADRLRGRAGLERVAPGFREAVAASIQDASLNGIREPLVACEDLTVESVNNSTLFVAGELRVRTFVGNNSRAVARRIVASGSARPNPADSAFVPDTFQVWSSITLPLRLASDGTSIRDARADERVCRLTRDPEGSELGFESTIFWPVSADVRGN